MPKKALIILFEDVDNKVLNSTAASTLDKYQRNGIEASVIKFKEGENPEKIKQAIAELKAEKGNELMFLHHGLPLGTKYKGHEKFEGKVTAKLLAKLGLTGNLNKLHVKYAACYGANKNHDGKSNATEFFEGLNEAGARYYSGEAVNGEHIILNGTIPNADPGEVRKSTMHIAKNMRDQTTDSEQKKEFGALYNSIRESDSFYDSRLERGDSFVSVPNNKENLSALEGTSYKQEYSTVKKSTNEVNEKGKLKNKSLFMTPRIALSKKAKETKNPQKLERFRKKGPRL